MLRTGEATRSGALPVKAHFSRVRSVLAKPLCQAAAASTTALEAATFEVSTEIVSIRSSTTERLKFEVEYGLKRGTTENAYLLKGPTRDSTVLVDLPSEPFAASFLLELQKVLPAKKIGKIFLTHVPSDVVPVLKSLLRLMNPDGSNLVEVYVTKAALRFLQNSLDDEEGMEPDVSGKCTLNAVQFGEMISISGGIDFECVRAATPRWPDMMAIYVPQRKILFSSELFSAHVTSTLTEIKETPFDVGGWQTYGNDWRYFFETMLAPSAQQVSKALEALNFSTASASMLPTLPDWFGQVLSWVSPAPKTEEQLPKARPLVGICPMHGPVVRNSLHELVENYLEWIQNQTVRRGTIAVFYASAYGNTAALAQAISHGVRKSGLGIETVNLEVSEPVDVEKTIAAADGFIIGSPTLGGHPPTQVQTALGLIVSNAQAKQLPCGVFGSFGWSGEAIDEMEQRLQDAGFKFAFAPIRVKMKPTAKICEESGTDLAQRVEKKLKKRDRQVISVTRSRQAPSTSQAVGRIVGSLCVISGKDGEAESGMLASWVSQASFDPPGLTVAVKKDRAVENVLLLGNRFNVNILAEGKESEIVKHMLQPFKPGQNRFDGLITEVCEETGCVVIHTAVSYLECTVQERLEAGDHWIVYATVEGGGVLSKDDISAVHHRKNGSNY